MKLWDALLTRYREVAAENAVPVSGATISVSGTLQALESSLELELGGRTGVSLWGGWRRTRHVKDGASWCCRTRRWRMAERRNWGRRRGRLRSRTGRAGASGCSEWSYCCRSGH